MLRPLPRPLLRRCSLVLLAAAVLAAGGCLPNKVTLDLAPGDGDLKEKAVITDPGASADGPKVALIDVDGLISHTAGGGLIAGRDNSVDNLVSRLAKAEADPNIRAVVLRVNSPGGSVAASESMYREIRGFRERTGRPVVVSMAEVAASGGYYISLAADRIIAQPTSITGSIGVIIQTVNFSKGMANWGIEARAVKSGANKDLANPFEPIRDSQYAVLQSTVDDFYAAFRALVAERRSGIDPARLPELADGRIFTGRQALAAGLVDLNGDLRDAYRSAKDLARVPKARLVKYHSEGREPWSPYASARAPGAAAADSGATQVNLLQLNVPGFGLPGPGFYYLWTPGVE